MNKWRAIVKRSNRSNAFTLDVFSDSIKGAEKVALNQICEKEHFDFDDHFKMGVEPDITYEVKTERHRKLVFKLNEFVDGPFSSSIEIEQIL